LQSCIIPVNLVHFTYIVTDMYISITKKYLFPLHYGSDTLRELVILF
jgi:hypothetical protein